MRTRQNGKRSNPDVSIWSCLVEERLNVDERYDGPSVKHQGQKDVAKSNIIQYFQSNITHKQGNAKHAESQYRILRINLGII